jgi:hypothetical protein
MLRCLEIEFLSLPASFFAVSSICAAPFTNMCSTQADNNSRKSRLRCGCQFPWCAPGRRFESSERTYSWIVWMVWIECVIYGPNVCENGGCVVISVATNKMIRCNNGKLNFNKMCRLCMRRDGAKSPIFTDDAGGIIPDRILYCLSLKVRLRYVRRNRC